MTKNTGILTINPNKIKVGKTSGYDKSKYAEIIAKKLEGKTYDQLVKECGVSKQMAFDVIHRNKELFDELENKKTEALIEREERLISEFTDLLSEKAKQLKNNDQLLENTRASELTQVIKDLFGKIQLQKGQPTTISQKYKDKSLEDLKIEVLRMAKLLKNNNKVELLEAVFGEKQEG